MSILPNFRIRQKSIITPYHARVAGEGILSHGEGFYGYDITLGTQFSRPFYGQTLDPKKHEEQKWEEFMALRQPFVLPPKEFVLGVSLERFVVPKDVIGVAVTKSTYARLGIFCNITPLEPGWRGYLTIEIANLGYSNVVIYPSEGIAQVMFFQGEQPEGEYAGKYQDQKGITHAK